MMLGNNNRRTWQDGKNSRRDLAAGRHSVIEFLERRMLLSVALNGTAARQTLADLPAAAQAAISSDLGQDQSAYHAASGAAGITLANPANQFTAQMQAGALQLAAGADTWDMTLAGLGDGTAVTPVGSAQTSINVNRVDNNYGAVDEWYVNGPNGLEQGFTVAPQADADGTLTVQLALGGDLTGTVNAASSGLTLSRPDGSAALTYTGLTAYDASGKTLPAWLQVRTDGGHQDLLIQVNAAGAQGAITIDPWVQLAELTASDGGGNNYFGTAVAISGNTVVVGASQSDGFTANGAGSAYVFVAPATGWGNMTQTAELTASDGATGDNFGVAVAINGNTVVVGANQATVDSNDYQGAAYVFVESARGWISTTQTAKLTASDGGVDDEFGGAVAISGKTVVVGADYAMLGNNIEQGEAYVFVESARGWTSMTQTAKLTASDGALIDEFGSAVAISGGTVLVGAENATVTGNTTGQGAAYVFNEPANGWADMNQTAKLTPSTSTKFAYFGNAVALSGNIAVVGAYGANAAYVFAAPATGWKNMTQTARLTASDGGAEFGASVSLSGNMVAVSGGGDGYLFTQPATGWANASQPAAVVPDDYVAAIAISGKLVVAGAPDAMVGRNEEQGAAYVFTDTIVTVNPPANQTATAGQSQTFNLGNFTQANAVAPYNVDVNWGDGSSDSLFSQPAAGTILGAAHTYTTAGSDTVTVTVSESSNHVANSAAFGVAVVPATPSFLRLSASSSVPFGTTAVTVSGAIAADAGTFIPPINEAVAVTLNGVTQDAFINSHGNFSTVFSTTTLPAGTYPLTYAYAGDANFNPVTNNTTTTLTVIAPVSPTSIAGTVYADNNGPLTGLSDVMVYLDNNGNGKLDAGETSVTTDANGNYLFGNLSAGTYTVRESAPGGYMLTAPAVGYLTVPLSTGQSVTGQTFTNTPVAGGTPIAVYRLYSPVTLEHLYTTDANEYHTLESYVGTWNGEGQVFNEYSGPATVSNVADEPLYRLYDAPDKQHFWTDNYNEYNTLRQAPWNWNDEGIVGYVFPSAVAASEPLYRLTAPQVHLWTTNLTEYDTLAGEGWTQEGVIGYVV